MALTRPTLLGILAIALSLSRVSPLSIKPGRPRLFRGTTATSSTSSFPGRSSTSSSSSSSSSSSGSNNRSSRCRQQGCQQRGMAGAAMMVVAAAASPSGVERRATIGPSSSKRQRRRPGDVRCRALQASAAADGSISGTPLAPTVAMAAAASESKDAAVITTTMPAATAPPASLEGATVSSAASADGATTAPLTFRELYGDRLPDWLLTRLEQLGFATPTLVQRQALEVILGDDRNDAVLHAQTGSGKTLAFLLPLFALVNPSRSAVQGLVVVPTRELGLQVAGVAKRLAAGTGPGRDSKIQVMSVLEGSSNKRQRAWAWADPPHIVIGNPENLSRLVTTGAVRVNAVSYVVVDEVDACLLSEGTRAWLHELLARSLSPTHADDDDDREDEEEAARLTADGAGRVTGNAAPVNKRVKDRQTVFASATVPQHNHFIKQCVQKQWTLTEPVHVQVHAKEAMPPGLSHFYVVCPPEQKLAVLRALVRRELGVSSSSLLSPPSPVEASATAAALAASGAVAGAGAGEQGKGPPSPGVGASSNGGSGGGGGGTADNRGLVFALATKPLEAIAGSLDKALGGGGGGVGGGDVTGKQEQQAKGKGGASAPPPLAEFLREELGLNARADTMSLFREGKTRLLVSTDMAARGLDVPEITHVFNLDLPADGEGYVHRGGRAGRLGRLGKIISIVTPQQEFVIRRLGNGIGVDIKKISLGSSKKKAAKKKRARREETETTAEAP